MATTRNAACTLALKVFYFNIQYFVALMYIQLNHLALDFPVLKSSVDLHFTVSSLEPAQILKYYGCVDSFLSQGESPRGTIN